MTQSDPQASNRTSTPMLPIEDIREKILAALPDASVEIIANPGPSGQHSLLVANEDAAAVALFLRDDPDLRMDFCSNVTGVDWPERTVRESVTISEEVDGEQREVKKQVDRTIPGYLEVVYHLYSMTRKHGPLILRLRTGDREDEVEVPSLTPVWRSAEFQEREAFDLYGIRFTGHPDLRRLLMWEEYEGHPMRKDFVPPHDEEDRVPFAPARRNEA